MPDDLSSLMSITNQIYGFLVHNWEGLVAVLSILVNGFIWRKQEQFKKQLQSELQTEQQKFTLGAASHMAIKIFDKQCEFAEVYINYILKTLNEFNYDKKEKLRIYANELTNIRYTYQIWLQKDISTNLAKFEQKLREAGTVAFVHGNTAQSSSTDPQISSKKADALFKMEEIIIDFFYPLETSKTEHPEAKIQFALDNIRILLGIDDIAHIREIVIKNATSKTTNN